MRLRGPRSDSSLLQYHTVRPKCSQKYKFDTWDESRRIFVLQFVESNNTVTIIIISLRKTRICFLHLPSSMTVLLSLVVTANIQAAPPAAPPFLVCTDSCNLAHNGVCNDEYGPYYHPLDSRLNEGPSDENVENEDSEEKSDSYSYDRWNQPRSPPPSSPATYFPPPTLPLLPNHCKRGTDCTDCG
jgi:hypothetical protein